MEASTVWFILIGALFILVGISRSLIERLPVTTSILYLVAGITLGPNFLAIVELDIPANAKFFEHLSEIVVIVSLFCAGLKLRLPLRNHRWRAPVRLALVTMIAMIGLVALFSHFVLHLPWGAGILLGAILAPTDPVLASDVQVQDPSDRDRLRFSLTGEAGLNDGAAFPFVMLGLALLGAESLSVTKWLLKDVIWAVSGGLLIGWALGKIATHGILFLRRRDEETTILDDFVAVGLIGLSYGVALAVHTYGFLAVFAAGLAMRRIEVNKPSEGEHAETPKEVLTFTEQLERIGEVFTVVLVGAVLRVSDFQTYDLVLIPILFLVIRPLSSLIGLVGIPMSGVQRSLISWFGIRGIGSVYYLSYAFNHGMPDGLQQRFTSITVACISISIIVHGISTLPFMRIYHRYHGRAESDVATV